MTARPTPAGGKANHPLPGLLFPCLGGGFEIIQVRTRGQRCQNTPCDIFSIMTLKPDLVFERSPVNPPIPSRGVRSGRGVKGIADE